MKQMLKFLAVPVGLLALLVVMNIFAPDRVEQRLFEAQQARAEELALPGSQRNRDENISARIATFRAERMQEKEDADTAAAPVDAEPAGDGTFRVKLETTKGDIIIECRPDWAPIGAARMKEAVEAGVYDDAAFFRVIDGFMVQFGIPGDPAVSAEWSKKMIKRDPVKASNTRGMVTFAQSSSLDSRTTQIFINFGDNSRLDRDGFSPIGKVVEGMDVVNSLNGEYGNSPSGRQAEIQQGGNEFLRAQYPNLDYIKKATIVSD